MTPTVEVVRITGHGTDHLSLHTTRRQAMRAVEEVGRLIWRNRFDHDLHPDADGYSVIGRLRDEGWTVTVAAQEVEL